VGGLPVLVSQREVRWFKVLGNLNWHVCMCMCMCMSCLSVWSRVYHEQTRSDKMKSSMFELWNEQNASGMLTESNFEDKNFVSNFFFAKNVPQPKIDTHIRSDIYLSGRANGFENFVPVSLKAFC
jgi:hypothetical protein